MFFFQNNSVKNIWVKKTKTTLRVHHRLPVQTKAVIKYNGSKLLIQNNYDNCYWRWKGMKFRKVNLMMFYQRACMQSHKCPLLVKVEEFWSRKLLKLNSRLNSYCCLNLSVKQTGHNMTDSVGELRSKCSTKWHEKSTNKTVIINRLEDSEILYTGPQNSIYSSQKMSKGTLSECN